MMSWDLNQIPCFSLQVTNIIPVKGGNPPKYAQRTQLLTENYQVV